MEITAALVKELRDRSGVGMMECKKALVETGGNIDKAFDLGFISFNENGQILISDHLEECQVLGIHSNMKIMLADQHQDYLAYHREHQFKQ